MFPVSSYLNEARREKTTVYLHSLQQYSYSLYPVSLCLQLWMIIYYLSKFYIALVVIFEKCLPMILSQAGNCGNLLFILIICPERFEVSLI